MCHADINVAKHLFTYNENKFYFQNYSIDPKVKATTERTGIPGPCMSLQSYHQQHMRSLKVSTGLLINPVLKVHMEGS